MNAEEKLNEERIKTEIADVIIKFNFVEQRINEIIEKYIDSDAEYFIKNILLNGLILNFGSKFKILQYIIATEQISVPSDFKNSLHMLMSRRNLIAHSDNLLGFYQYFVDVEYVYDSDIQGVTERALFEDAEPDISIFENGKVDYLEVSKVLQQFNKYYGLIHAPLATIFDHVSNNDATKFPNIAAVIKTKYGNG